MKKIFLLMLLCFGCIASRAAFMIYVTNATGCKVVVKTMSYNVSTCTPGVTANAVEIPAGATDMTLPVPGHQGPWGINAFYKDCLANNANTAWNASCLPAMYISPTCGSCGKLHIEWISVDHVKITNQ